MISTSVIIAIVVCCLLIIGTVLSVYFSGVTCPDFGYECVASPAPSPAAGTPGPAARAPAPSPAAGTPGPATRTPGPATRSPGPTTPTTPTTSCNPGKYFNGTSCVTCSEPNTTQYVTSVCTPNINTQFAPLACPVGTSTSEFDFGSASRLGYRTCVTDVAATIVPQGQTCPAGQYIVNGVCITCPPGYNYNSLNKTCYAEI